MKRFYVVSGLAALALFVFLGCSAGGDSETAQSEEPAVKIEKPASTDEEAQEVALALSNPKEGVDPVCGMSVDGSTVVTINDKHYAVCGAHCGEQLTADPDKYLVVAAATDE